MDQDSWYFKIIYNTLVDRFFDGNKQNNRSILDPKLHELANFQGGDIVGINKKLNEGYFSDLGINLSGSDQEMISKYNELQNNLATAKTKYISDSLIVKNLKHV